MVKLKIFPENESTPMLPDNGGDCCCSQLPSATCSNLGNEEPSPREEQQERAGSSSGTMEPSKPGSAFKITFICQPVNRKQASLMEFVDLPEENILPSLLFS